MALGLPRRFCASQRSWLGKRQLNNVIEKILTRKLQKAQSRLESAANSTAQDGIL
jgi:hypothetical protein